VDNRTPILDRTDYSVVWAERFPHETDGDVLQRVKMSAYKDPRRVVQPQRLLTAKEAYRCHPVD
jgi:hypothetical protein